MALGRVRKMTRGQIDERVTGPGTCRKWGNHGPPASRTICNTNTADGGEQGEHDVRAPPVGARHRCHHDGWLVSSVPASAPARLDRARSTRRADRARRRARRQARRRGAGGERGGRQEHVVDPRREEHRHGQVDLQQVARQQPLAVEQGRWKKTWPSGVKSPHVRTSPSAAMTYQIHHRAASGLRRWRRARSPNTTHERHDADVARHLGKAVGGEEVGGERRHWCPATSGSSPSTVSDLFIEPDVKYL